MAFLISHADYLIRNSIVIEYHNLYPCGYIILPVSSVEGENIHHRLSAIIQFSHFHDISKDSYRREQFSFRHTSLCTRSASKVFMCVSWP